MGANDTARNGRLTPEGAAGGHGFGTAPVFLASICTILGAIMFLRFGYAVAHAGVVGALAIIVLGHVVTVATALAISEIATNQRVEGGGEFFIVSRSFGTTIGGAIGIPLYLSQAISVAFYMIAFAEAFRPIAGRIEAILGMPFDPRMISLPGAVLLVLLVLLRGANLGVGALWLVAVILTIALGAFFLGDPVEGAVTGSMDPIPDADPFMIVFAIIFPAFTGMTAGVGLSGDLAQPRRSIPLGVLSATAVGFVVYIFQVIKLATSASPEMLAEDPLIMSRIALWGPIIPIGLAAATVSSAIGSILVAPRTLQAMAKDRLIQVPLVNQFLQEGRGETNEPRNATLVTGIIAIFFVSIGSVDFVARIISMFFMVTYGSLCAISFLEHFAARPSYRPSFRSRWYISLLGAVASLLLMIQMDPLYAFLSLIVLAAIYKGIQVSREGRVDDLAALFRNAFAQLTRRMQIKLQRSVPVRASEDWRPSFIMINSRTFERHTPIQFLSWLCHRYGFGTYLHFIQGHLDEETYEESRRVLSELIRKTEYDQSGVFVDTIISPSMKSALAQSLQVPGVSGMENNSVLMEFSVHDGEVPADEILGAAKLAAAARMNCCILRHGDHFFGNRAEIHIWLTWHDYRNANLMILLAYILLGHPDWRRARIAIYAALPQDQAREETERLRELISAGRLPISERRVRIIPTTDRIDFESRVENRSRNADLVIFGLTRQRLEEKGAELLTRHPSLRDVLFVCAQERILIE